MANRTLTDTATIAWDEATAAQVKGNVVDGSVSTAKLADNGATNAKLADMAQATIKGRAAGAGTGDPTDLTATQVAAIVDSFFLTPAEGNTAYQPVDSDLTAIAALTTTAYGRALLALADDAALQAYIGAREVLIAARTYFVRTDGSDSNTGLVDSAGGAFLTLDKARQAIYALDLNGFTVTVDIGNGTYTAGVTCTGMPPGWDDTSPITFTGDTSTPANVIISTTSANCFASQDGAVIRVEGVELRTTTSGDCLFATNGGRITHGNVRFGTCATFHKEASEGGRISNSGNYSIVGGAQAHQHVTSGGFQLMSAATVTLTGTPNFSVYFLGINGAYAQYSTCTFSGSATGVRYVNHQNGVIQTDGQSISTYIPGNSTGVQAGGGQFDDIQGTLTSNAAIKSSSTGSGVGYITGAGASVTQATSKSTGVTINNVCGRVIMNNAALGGGGVVAFAVTNSSCVLGDVVILNHAGGAVDGGTYRLVSYNVVNGSFNIQLTNISGGSLSEAVEISFAILKAVRA